MEKQIIEWYNKGGDPAEGQLLLQQAKIRGRFTRPSKILYELCKYAKMKAFYFSKRNENNEIEFPVPSQKEEQGPGPEGLVKDDPHTYKLSIDEFPKYLQEKIILKGQLYNQLDMLKKQLFDTGEKNGPAIVKARETIITEAKQVNKQIKSIYVELREFEDNGQIKEEPITEPVQPLENSEEIIPELNDEFRYAEMDYFARKDLLVRLRKNVPKQEKAAKEHAKAAVRERNEKKAALGRQMIDVLASYFNETKA